MAFSPISIPDISNIGGGDALIIVPPFAGLTWPSVGVHQIQASAALEGLEVRILYANLIFAACFGQETFHAVRCVSETSAELIGERLFARAAYGRTPLGLPMDGGDDERFSRAIKELRIGVSLAELRTLEAHLPEWIDRLADAVVALGFPVVGASTTFEQTSAAIALLAAVKRRRPETIAVIGGSNCDGPMAEGLASLDAPIDHIFSGESEETFSDWLRAAARGERRGERVIRGKTLLDLDKLPPPDHRTFFEQRSQFLGEGASLQDASLFVTYESSRGCWWGEKHHCTFCGLNGMEIRYREKSPDKVIDDLTILAAQTGIRTIRFVDNIMPHRYFRTLLPRLQDEAPGLMLFYEVKSNLTFEKLLLLKRAGVIAIQPGIESLSTPLLRLMDKGVTAAQNLALLRYARTVSMGVDWNVLYRYPNDAVSHYDQMLALFPLIHHLQPPTWLTPLRIDRFSPYYEQPSRYGLCNIRPLPAYEAVLPPGSRADLVAYTFLADYDSVVDERLEAELGRTVTSWKNAWASDCRPPALHVFEARPNVFLLLDTRGLPGVPPIQALDEARARAALVARISQNPPAEQSAAREWAISQRVAVWLDDEYVPLATAHPDLLSRFEAEAKTVLA